MRIQKFLSQQGISSRREAERLIGRGLVSVNGKVIREMGIQIDPDKDKVAVLSSGQKVLRQKTTVLINKPRGIASSRIKAEGTTIYDLFPQYSKLDIIGRLDKASEGLLMLSDDGVLARLVTGQEHLVEKEYAVTVREQFSPSKVRQLEPGIPLEDPSSPSGQVMTLPAKVRHIGSHSFNILLREGRKHQIRRMCQYLHLTIIRLIRLRIGLFTLSNMKIGESRIIPEAEMQKFKSKYTLKSNK